MHGRGRLCHIASARDFGAGLDMGGMGEAQGVGQAEGAGAPDWVFESAGPEATRDFARAIGAKLKGGEIILLRGELGAGKTCFAGGLAEGLGISEPAISPTFVILRSYLGSRGVTLHHIDFYRLAGGDLETLGVEDLESEDAVILAEWPEQCPGAFPASTAEIRFIVTGDETRRIEGRWGGLANGSEGWAARV